MMTKTYITKKVEFTADEKEALEKTLDIINELRKDLTDFVRVNERGLYNAETEREFGFGALDAMKETLEKIKSTTEITGYRYEY